MDEESTPLAAFLATITAQATADPSALYQRLPALRAALGLAAAPDDALDDAPDDADDEAELAVLEEVAAVKALNVSLLRLVPHLLDAEGSDEPEDNLFRLDGQLAAAKARLHIAQLRERYGLGDDDPDDGPEAA